MIINRWLDLVIAHLLKYLDEKFFFPIRRETITSLLSPYFSLGSNKKILDVGSSNGRIAKMLQDEVGGEFVGVDILVQPETYIPIKEYDGRNLPFPDNSFDYVMLVDVLHHVEDQPNLLREMKRVSRQYILIKDHYWNNRLDFLILKIADYIGNKPYGVKILYKYWQMADWHRAFTESDLHIIKEKKLRLVSADPVKQIVFLLEKV